MLPILVFLFTRQGRRYLRAWCKYGAAQRVRDPAGYTGLFMYSISLFVVSTCCWVCRVRPSLCDGSVTYHQFSTHDPSRLSFSGVVNPVPCYPWFCTGENAHLKYQSR